MDKRNTKRTEETYEGEHSEYDFLEYDVDDDGDGNTYELWWFMGHDDRDYCLEHNICETDFVLTDDGATLERFDTFEEAMEIIERKYI